jgi:hypothetical protein
MAGNILRSGCSDRVEALPLDEVGYTMTVPLHPSFIFLSFEHLYSNRTEILKSSYVQPSI